MDGGAGGGGGGGGDCIPSSGSGGGGCASRVNCCSVPGCGDSNNGSSLMVAAEVLHAVAAVKAVAAVAML